MTLDVRPVADDQWDVVGWLWQAFRHDLALVVNGYPYADGRYQHAWLDEYPMPTGTGYLAWQPHPNTGEDAPVGFALVTGVGTGRCGMRAFWVVPPARRGGLGRRFALDVLARHPGPWDIAFQENNVPAARFWREVATEAWGPEGGGWTETAEPVPGKPHLLPDRWIRTRPVA